MGRLLAYQGPSVHGALPIGNENGAAGPIGRHECTSLHHNSSNALSNSRKPYAKRLWLKEKSILWSGGAPAGKHRNTTALTSNNLRTEVGIFPLLSSHRPVLGQTLTDLLRPPHLATIAPGFRLYLRRLPRFCQDARFCMIRAKSCPHKSLRLNMMASVSSCHCMSHSPLAVFELYGLGIVTETAGENKLSVFVASTAVTE